jgi:hypothetical protein
MLIPRLHAHAQACRGSSTHAREPYARASPTVRALTGSRQAESTESSGFRVRSVSGSTRVHPSRACMLGFPGTLHDPNSRIRLSPPSGHVTSRQHMPSIPHGMRTHSTHTRALRARYESTRTRHSRASTTVPTASLLPAARALAPTTWSYAASPCSLLPS